MALCLVGCGKAPEAQTPTAAPVHIVTPVPATPGEDVLLSGRSNGTRARVVYSVAEETACWQVESWEIYPSWDAAGVDTKELIVSEAERSKVLQAADGGGMLIARMRYTNETIDTDGTVWCYAADLGPTVDGRAVDSTAVWFPERGQNVIDGGPWGTAFYIPAKGESAVLTLGWVLTPEAVEAARNGELSLLVLSGSADIGGTLLPLTLE